MSTPTITLLIVDDEPSLCAALSVVFTRNGYDVRCASDGFAALALIEERAPCILLSDLNMPGMSGFELLSVVRRVHPAIHVVATSASFSGRNVPDGIAADAFYEKAAGLQVLFELIREASQGGRRHRRSSPALTPIWVSPTGMLPSKEFYVLMGCPRCLRAFPKVLLDKPQFVCETECVYCGAAISYAVAPTTETRTAAKQDAPLRGILDSVASITLRLTASETGGSF
jgi:CheY-like chemotaxis protein